MSKRGRQELLEAIRLDYAAAGLTEKQTMLDSLVQATGYNRKYVIQQLGQATNVVCLKRTRKAKYDSDVKDALKRIWLASNKIASKRLIPFLPILLDKLEKYGHIQVSEEVKAKLLELSAATADRLLKDEKKKYGRSMTRPGRLLKKHIPVRTFADWNDVIPGFMEADLVAHCGETTKGQFLHTLTMTDIFTGWTEVAALLNKTESEAMSGIKRIKGLLPFPLKGLDTDNGGEFINSTTLVWCTEHRVTFTRSRPYKKNDQAHVEEKNGSIVRRFVGYDRYEGKQSLAKLAELYDSLRLYVNYFQPSMKLLSKQRDGAKVSRRYEQAATPYERVMQSCVDESVKNRLTEEFEWLDPVKLLIQVEELQDELWKTATDYDPERIAKDSLAKALESFEEAIPIRLDEHRNNLRKRAQTIVSDRPQKEPKPLRVSQIIYQHICSLPAGEPFETRHLLDLGPRAAIDRTLSRLTKQNVIVRLSTGRYVAQTDNLVDTIAR
jgi:hypothetical protein